MIALPVLSTERLLLRVPAVEDAERVAAYHAENRLHLAPWEPIRPEEFYTAEYWTTILGSCAREVRDERSIPFILLRREEPEGPVLGRCTLSNLVRGAFQAAHLGFSLAGGMVGKGLMFEGLSALVAYAFDDLRLHRIMANYVPGNTRSARLLERLGFEVEGRASEYLRINGEWRDHILTSLIHRRWRGP